MKRSALKPGKPLERKSELRPKETGRNLGNCRRTQGNFGKRRPISPASKAQRAVVKGRPCLVCGAWEGEYVSIDPAHLWARGRGGCDSSFCVVPLCRRFDGGCHRAFDEGRLDLLSVLVADFGRWRHHVQHALQHATPVQLLERLGSARIEWSA